MRGMGKLLEIGRGVEFPAFTLQFVTGLQFYVSTRSAVCAASLQRCSLTSQYTYAPRLCHHRHQLRQEKGDIGCSALTERETELKFGISRTKLPNVSSMKQICWKAVGAAGAGWA
jgi:hypothetical protein